MVERTKSPLSYHNYTIFDLKIKMKKALFLVFIATTVLLFLAYVKTGELLFAISGAGFIIATIFEYLSFRRR